MRQRRAECHFDFGIEFPFDKSKWVKSEPDIDHDAVTRESAK